MIDWPRQARDKHEEKLRKRGDFCREELGLATYRCDFSQAYRNSGSSHVAFTKPADCYQDKLA
jgi:hypothetical protein